MPTIIKADSASDAVPFEFNDMAEVAKQSLAHHRAEAAAVLDQARREADGIRDTARQEGRRSADEHLAQQVDAILPALRQAVAGLEQARHDWLEHWEKTGLKLALAIAERIIRRELARAPEITLGLLKEALELAAGAGDIEIHLHPDDLAALGRQVERLTKEVGRVGKCRVIADPAISCGGCRVDSRFGSIDQQIEAQLARIEQELS
jgi:flagellar assembly protein FliH